MISIYADYPLLAHNTFGMDVVAKRYIEYSSAEDLKEILSQLEPGEPLLAIGGGSNLLFTGRYEGTVLHSAILGSETVREDTDHVWLRVGAGETWDEWVGSVVAQGLGGAENLSLIPGEVGASAVQNIGAYGVEAKDLITEVETLEVATGEPRTFTVDECRYGYRDSIFKQELKGRYIVTYVTYRLDKHPLLRLDYGNIRSELEQLNPSEITPATVRNVIIRIRESKLPDPKKTGNAGSFFMNPVIPRSQFEALQQQYPDMPHYEVNAQQVKIPAAWMIDRCGWKGRSMGHAGVHEKQPLVLINRGGATGAEIIALSEAICASVREKFGIDIHPEVNFI
jgi:UDP-N-acetylmuramate dehydrogenase